MPPSPFVIEWAPRAAASIGRGPQRTPRALDVAMGSGRHIDVLSRAGFKVFGVDRSFDDVRQASAAARASGVSLSAWCADLVASPLPEHAFDLVLVTRYLQRDLFPSLKRAVTPGGFVLYETFTQHQRQHGRGPTSNDHLLEPGELRSYFLEFEVLFYEECAEPDALANLVARRRP